MESIISEEYILNKYSNICKRKINNLYTVWGIRRSGNHAIIHWLKSHFEKPVAFINDVNPESKFLYPKLDKWRNHRKYQTYLRLRMANLKRWDIDVNNGIVSVESYNFKKIKNIEEKINSNFGEVFNNYNIIVLRDPYNLFASLLKHHSLSKDFKNKTKKYIGLWKIYACEFLGKTNYLKNKYCINYNLWHNSIQYRKTIIEDLGFIFHDSNKDNVAKEGDGSSFDELKYSKEAYKMRLEERWKEFIDDEFYNQLFDDQIAKLSNKIFGNIIRK